MARIIDQLTQLDWNFDVLTDSSHTDQVEWTRHPVEGAVSVSDHAQEQPAELSLGGVVTNAPLGPAIATPQRAEQAYERLLEMAYAKRLVTVVTDLRVYRDMAILRVGLQRAEGSGDAVYPTVDLRQVFITTATWVAIPPEILSGSKSNQSELDAGVQAGMKLRLEEQLTEATTPTFHGDDPKVRRREVGPKITEVVSNPLPSL